MKIVAWATALAFLLAACQPNGPTPFPPAWETEIAAELTRTAATATPAAELTVEAYLYPTPTPDDDITLVILGQDETSARCERGERCGAGSHSDVFVIVHVADNKATAVLIPRSLYVPPAMMLHGTGFEGESDIWSMAVYGLKGFEGVRMYVRVVFGLQVDGVFAINMDDFEALVDSVGGLTVSTEAMDGSEVLAYLRDNENNWGCIVYDCEGRIFSVATALRVKARDMLGQTILSLLSDPIIDIKTDMEWVAIVAGLARYVAFEVSGGTVEYIRLWIPPLQSDDTPLEIRGLVPTRPLYEWMAEVLAD
jgi:hypothetical protein